MKFVYMCTYISYFILYIFVIWIVCMTLNMCGEVDFFILQTNANTWTYYDQTKRCAADEDRTLVCKRNGTASVVRTPGSLWERDALSEKSSNQMNVGVWNKFAALTAQPPVLRESDAVYFLYTILWAQPTSPVLNINKYVVSRRLTLTLVI